MRFLVASLLLLCGNALGEIKVVDDYGHPVHLPAPATRIVSLAPHLTELLYAAGAGPKLVGAVAFSDFPPEARALPRVGNDALIDLEAVLALRPDLIVAWPNPGTVRAVNRLAELQLPVFRSEPRELEDIAGTISRLGILVGTELQADRAAAAFRARAAELEKRYSGRPAVRVFYEVWDRPLITVNGDHVISKVIRLCGGENVFAGLPGIAPQIDREAVLRANPKVIVGSDAISLDDWKGYPVTAHLHRIPAALIERHTPRILEGAERLCGILEGARTAR
jgi:iron complex transport system substrate-binding protein